MRHLDPQARTPTDALQDLYEREAGPLRRIVSSVVRAPEAVIDDACQVAWSRLIPRQKTISPETTLSWLVTTASREAIRLNRRADRDVSLEALVDEPAQERLPEVPSADEVAAQRDRLTQIQYLPRRQQQLVWLHGLGLTYKEMAGYTGSSRRTVERQLLRAKHALRAA